MVSKSNRGMARSIQSSRTNEPVEVGQLDRMKAQRQAETLLEQSVGHSPGAVDEISSRVNEWHGKVRWNSRIANLTTAALNSGDLRVRESGMEVELAAYGLSKNLQTLEYLLKTADSRDPAQRVWALRAPGPMANRGAETEQVASLLASHLADADIDSRRWAVEALAPSGTDRVMETSLKTMHDDLSPIVRERAAWRRRVCSLRSSALRRFRN
jgi:HEAT repeat protein